MDRERHGMFSGSVSGRYPSPHDSEHSHHSTLELGMKSEQSIESKCKSRFICLVKRKRKINRYANMSIDSCGNLLYVPMSRRQWHSARCTDNSSLQHVRSPKTTLSCKMERVCIVTDGNSGGGFELCRILCATIYMTSRLEGSLIHFLISRSS